VRATPKMVSVADQLKISVSLSVSYLRGEES
jgi:hypothetical protein